MAIYRCSITHRSNAINDCIRERILFIETDSPETAYLLAKENTKGIDSQVDEPVIQLYLPPKPNIKCSTKNAIAEYGQAAYRAAQRRMTGRKIETTSDGAKRPSCITYIAD